MELALQQEKAKQLRADIVKMTYLAKSGHPGGSLSCVEMLMALYYNIMKVDPSNPGWEERDRFVLSKGHACPALYAVLADKGYFPREDLWTLRKFHSHLQGHPDMRKTPGVDANTGSLGQGVSIAGGMALAAKYKGESHRVFVITGDGESQEGLVWEAAMSAGQFNTTNMIAFVDRNRLEMDGPTEDEMKLEPFADKWAAFGFDVKEIDGHNFKELCDAIDYALAATEKPVMIICNTVKGCGIDFMENDFKWHYGAIDQDLHDKASKSLDAYYKKRVERVEKEAK